MVPQVRLCLIAALSVSILLAQDPGCPAYPSSLRTELQQSLELDRAFGAYSLKARGLNLKVAPHNPKLASSANFIDQAIQTGIVYVHCKIGYSRSAAVVCAWLLHSGLCATVDDAVAFLRSKRPAVVVRSEIVTALTLFLAQCYPATQSTK